MKGSIEVLNPFWPRGEGRKSRGQLSTDRRNRNSSSKEIRLNVSGSSSKISGWTESSWTGDLTVINCIKLSTIFIEKESQVSQFADPGFKKGDPGFKKGDPGFSA